MNRSSFIFIGILLIFVKSSHSCEPPDCERIDCGTCGNACCNLEFLLRPDPKSLAEMMSSLLNSGGPDEHYTFVTANDLRPYNISADFILQGIHTTFVKRYNDTLNFVIFPLEGQKYFQSRVKAFSISQIGGAYCDDGQNYKNLILFIKGLNIEYIENHVAGCTPQFRP